MGQGIKPGRDNRRVIPFPLPPALARLHEILERYTEFKERGFFLAEQDRSGQAQGQPVLVFISAQQLSASPDPGKHPPAWMGEVVVAGADEARMQRCAAAGVPEFWRVFDVEGDTPRIEVHTEPGPGGYGSAQVFEGDVSVRSTTFPDLSLCAKDLRSS